MRNAPVGRFRRERAARGGPWVNGRYVCLGWPDVGCTFIVHLLRRGPKVHDECAPYGRVSPSVETLRKYAAAVGKRLRVELV